MRKIYIVQCNQYGCTQGHIYFHGAYFSKESAIHNAKAQFRERSGRYTVIVSETRHPNNHNRKRLTEIFRIESDYKDKLKSFSQT